jgi:hypothetical protein
MLFSQHAQSRATKPQGAAARPPSARLFPIPYSLLYK